RSRSSCRISPARGCRANSCWRLAAQEFWSLRFLLHVDLIGFCGLTRGSVRLFHWRVLVHGLTCRSNVSLHVGQPSGRQRSSRASVCVLRAFSSVSKCCKRRGSMLAKSDLQASQSVALASRFR